MQPKKNPDKQDPKIKHRGWEIKGYTLVNLPLPPSNSTQLSNSRAKDDFSSAELQQ